MSRPFKLFRLQQLDSQLDAHQTRLAQIATALQEDEQLQQAIAQAAEAEAQWKAAQLALRRAESEVSQQRIKIEQTEATLYSGRVHNPKELQDLQNDSAALKRYLSVLEDRQLDAMLAEEEAAARHEQAQNALAQARTASELRHASLSAEQAKLQRECLQLEQERQAALAAIPAEDLQLYNELRQKRRGVAVARVSDRACAACGSILSTSLLQLANSPNQLTRCETCGRILYAG